MIINIKRIDAGLHITPAPPYIINYLQYSRRGFKTVNWRKMTEYKKCLLFQTDGKGGVYTLPGFYEQILRLIERARDVAHIQDKRTKMPPIDWEAVKQIKLRDYQIDPIVSFLLKGQDTSGRFLGTGAFGKSYCIATTYAAWNTLNTIVAVPYQQVIDQLYNKFVELFPNKHIGRMGGGHRDISPDVTISTLDSLENCAIEKCKVLIIDEMQGAAGEEIQKIITKVKPIRTFGFTATDSGLFSQAEKVLLGLFGEALIEIGYREALAMGAVVPCYVYFVEMPKMDEQFYTDAGEALVHGVMKCGPRNKLIADIVKSIPNQWQSIIFLDQIKNHLEPLLKEIPDVKYVHRDTKHPKLKLKPKEQKQIIADFVDNKIQHLIATDCLRAGFDSQNCRVVVQAAGGSSSIEVLQEAFRGSRILPKERQEELGVDPKTHFILVDIWDTHSDILKGMSQKRKKFYEEQGWKVQIVKTTEEIDWSNNQDKASD